MEKYTWTELQEKDVESLKQIKEECSEKLYELKKEKDNLIVSILYLQDEVEKNAI